MSRQGYGATRASSMDNLAYSDTGRIVGRWSYDQSGCWLNKNIRSGAHKLNKPPGYATDASHLDHIREHGGGGLLLRLPDGEVLTARLEDFDAHGIPLDRRHGAQVVLPFAFWSSNRRNSARPARPEPVIDSVQPRLFDAEAAT